MGKPSRLLSSAVAATMPPAPNIVEFPRRRQTGRLVRVERKFTFDQLHLLKSMRCGVYEIDNIQTKQRYAGHTASGPKRLGRHLTMLKNGTHHAKKFQKSYREWGIENFVITIHEASEGDVPLKELLRLEQQYIDAIPDHLLLNSRRKAGSNKGHRRPGRAVRDNRCALKNRPKSEEHCANLSESAKLNAQLNRACAGLPAELKRPSNVNIWWVVAPDHIIHCTHFGLDEFCRRFRLDPRSLMRTLYGEYDHHHGWRMITEREAMRAGGEGAKMDDLGPILPYNHKFFAAVNVELGVVLVGANLQHLCGAFGLDRKCLEHTLKSPGKGGHRGWILLAMQREEIYQEKAMGLARKRLGKNALLRFHSV